ncbi:MAG: aromatic hydrocarbon degradation protein [Desulfobacterales bacterium]|nr:MAG: aromatic hydrocarbon degradation protein [Desulfobacterales bacterium]
MKKIISVAVAASVFVAGSVMASGFRIPEQSIDSIAKSGASVASADSADAAYYNPAGMALLPDSWLLETNVTYLHLTSIAYEDKRSPLYDGDSLKENFLLPTFFMVSPEFSNFRFGFSLTGPYGLQKRWDDVFPKAMAKQYGIKVFELNPTFSYKINEMFAISGGVRGIYTEASLRTDGVAFGAPVMELDGDSTEFGWNIGVDAKLNENLNVALTYRSKIDLGWEGDATVFIPGKGTIPTPGAVTVPAPAVLTASVAATVDEWTFDLTVDQTFWSEYEALVIDFERLPNVTEIKEWEDSLAFRLGVEYDLNEALTLMAGFAYDECPVTEAHLGFELPDSDAWLFSLGAKYRMSESMEIGVAVLYDYKEERDVKNSRIDGTISNASAVLVSFGLSYMF